MATPEKIKIAELEIEYKDVIAAQAELQEKMKDVREEIKLLEATQDVLRQAGKKDTEQYKDNAKAIEVQKTAMSGLKTEYKNNERILQGAIDAKNDEIGTIQKLDAENKKLRASLRSLDLTTEAGRKTQKEYIAQINANTEFIRKNSDAAIQQKMNIGNYKSALDILPGPLKNAASGMQTLGNAAKMFMANPLVLAITAIAGALALLFKAFKSTDEGATKLDGVMKALGNVVDVLMDRIKNFTNVLNDVFTFNFKALKEDSKAAFGGLSESLKDAAKAGYELAIELDDINDSVAANLISHAAMRKEMERQTTIARDQTLSYKERQAAAQKAMDLEIQINQEDVKWKEAATAAEIKNLAAKMQASDKTLEQKEAQLRAWLAYDGQQLASMKKTDAAFNDFYNKNEADFQKMQKLLSEDIDKQTELYLNTRRLTTQLSGFNKELRDEYQKTLDEREKGLQEYNEAAEKYYMEQFRVAEEEMLREVELEKQKIAEKERLRAEAAEKEKQWNEELAAFRAEKAFIDADNERIRREVEMNDRFQAELDLLAREQEAEIQAALKTGADVGLIQKKYAAIEKQVERDKQKAKLDIMAGFAGALAGLFDEETKLGKAAAIVQTVINTYKGAMSAFAETPGGIIIKSAAAATAVATGVAAVRNIMKTGKGGGGGAGISDIAGAGSSSNITTMPQTNYVTNVSAPQTVLVLEEFQMVQGRQVQVKQAGEL